jgi:2,4-dienoyl-CoA reductase-like NADH-dependent reductase (Old Yellow Enzyme family)
VSGPDRGTHRRFLYRDPEALRRDIEALDLPIPWAEDPRPLLEPVMVGHRTLPNRLAVHPMEGFDGDLDGGPSELTSRRYRRFAEGGCALIWFEATSVVEEGRSNPHQLCLTPRTAEEFTRLVAGTRRAASKIFGAGHDPLLVLQLTHSGRWSKPDGSRRPVIARHFDALDQMVDIDEGYPVVTDEELDELQEVFVGAARLAEAAGFDAVDVKACHGYLVSELLGSFTREGRYGGSLENRSRFLLETAERIRTEVPAIMVTSRLNAFDGLPYPSGFGVSREDPDEPDLDEPMAILGKLKDLGAPTVNVTLGVPYCKPHLGRPFNRAVPGSPSAPEHPLVGISRFQTITGTLQRAHPDLPLIGTGYSWLRHFFPYVAAGAVAEGGVRLVGLGRMAFAYPDFARDLSEAGKLDSKKVCVGCSGCSELMRAGGPSGCVVRDGDLFQLPGSKPGGGGGP